jgi:uncharacterized membrane protein YozB (DUF420 family)
LSGLFGTGAILETDFNMLLQIIIVIVLLIGLYGRKRKVKTHTGIMIAATLAKFAAFLAFMGPIFFENLTFFLGPTYGGLSYLFHAFTGMITLALAFGLIISWATHASNLVPCYRRKRLMDVTIILWVTSVIVGIIGYVLVYVVHI